MVRIVLLALVASVASASANAARPLPGGGDPAGEPVGIADIAITREELVIDLRPLAERNALVRVTATYHLDNRSDEKQLDLVFATGSATRAFVITLDGTEVRSASSPDAKLPESWRPPATTPMFDGGELGYHFDHHEPRDQHPPPFGFQLVVPPGRHDLVITYRADPVREHYDFPTILYQFGYVLSPARSWAGFGGLDLTVHVPAGWRAAVTPALKRDGDTLHAMFPSIPADAVALTVQAPSGPYEVVRIGSRVLLALVVFGGLFLLVRQTRSSERRRLDAAQFPNGWAAFGRGFSWGAAFFVTGLFAIFGPDLVLPAGQAHVHRSYGQAFAAFGVVVGTGFAILFGWVVSHTVGRRVHLPPS